MASNVWRVYAVVESGTHMLAICDTKESALQVAIAASDGTDSDPDPDIRCSHDHVEYLLWMNEDGSHVLETVEEGGSREEVR